MLSNMDASIETFLAGRIRELCDGLRGALIEEGHDSEAATRAATMFGRLVGFEAVQRAVSRALITRDRLDREMKKWGYAP